MLMPSNPPTEPTPPPLRQLAADGWTPGSAWVSLGAGAILSGPYQAEVPGRPVPSAQLGVSPHLIINWCSMAGHLDRVDGWVVDLYYSTSSLYYSSIIHSLFYSTCGSYDRYRNVIRDDGCCKWWQWWHSALRACCLLL